MQPFSLLPRVNPFIATNSNIVKSKLHMKEAQKVSQLSPE